MAWEVVILPDNDVAGRRHAEKVLESLQEHGVPSKIIHLPGLVEGEDIADLIARGEMTQEKLLALVNGQEQASVANPPRLQVKIWSAQELSTTELPEPSWLVPGILPDHGLAVLAGKPKIGKS
ncbi:AAA family ATPase [Thermanaeromonas toyohensis]|uniref:AAA family ATPase n=1 Tax=Thermanaeromonas toyohensis TaxID=161154 RepID=UPI0012F50E86|nr:AAA family ATPase [Thermanaeromonas toyohensis]